jgi:hypothetical protein
MLTDLVQNHKGKIPLVIENYAFRYQEFSDCQIRILSKNLIL